MVTDNLISLKEKEKMNHDKQVTDLPKNNEGSDVWYCDHNKDIWEKDTVVEQDQNDRSYTLVKEHGKIGSCNCIDLKKNSSTRLNIKIIAKFPNHQPQALCSCKSVG